MTQKALFVGGALALLTMVWVVARDIRPPAPDPPVRVVSKGSEPAAARSPMAPHPELIDRQVVASKTSAVSAPTVESGSKAGARLVVAGGLFGRVLDERGAADRGLLGQSALCLRFARAQRWRGLPATR